MAEEQKKYLSIDGLTEYDGLIKNEIADSLLNAKNYSDANLSTAQTYIDNAVAQKSLVQIITWGVDD